MVYNSEEVKDPSFIILEDDELKNIVFKKSDGSHVVVSLADLSDVESIKSALTGTYVPTVGDSTIAGVIRITGGEIHFDVNGFEPGGTPTEKIEAALAAADAAGGGIVNVPDWQDTDLVYQPVPGYANHYRCIITRPHTTLRGRGKEATSLRLAAGQTLDRQTSDVAIVGNGGLDGGDTHIVVEDLTIDGNGANQTTLYLGFGDIRVSHALYRNVRVKNVRGTDNGPPGETGGHHPIFGSHYRYEDCDVIGGRTSFPTDTAELLEAGSVNAAAGTQGSGFMTTGMFDVSYRGCKVFGMTHGMPIAAHHCRGLSIVDFVGYLCRSGISLEYCDDVLLSLVRSGGAASATWVDGGVAEPYTTAQRLGHLGDGLIVNHSTGVIVDPTCSFRYNGNAGATFVQTEVGLFPEARIEGGLFTHNDKAFGFSGTAAQRVRISPSTIIRDNVTTDIVLPWTQRRLDTIRSLPAPAIPASGVALINPYPFDVRVTILGGTVSDVRLNTDSPGYTSGVFDLPGGDASQLQVYYTVAPTTFSWFRA